MFKLYIDSLLKIAQFKFGKLQFAKYDDTMYEQPLSQFKSKCDKQVLSFLAKLENSKFDQSFVNAMIVLLLSFNNYS